MAPIHNDSQLKRNLSSQSELWWVQPLLLVSIGIGLFLLLVPGEKEIPPTDEPRASGARQTPATANPLDNTQKANLGLGNSPLTFGRPLVSPAPEESWPGGRREESAAQPVEPPQHVRELDVLVTQFKNMKELTPEGAKDVKRLLRELRKQGAVVVPAIRDFLRSNEDVNFARMRGGELAEHHTLRQALFDTLKQIGGDQATAVALEQLMGNQDPAEIAMLARNLEEAEPGVYRDEAVRVASNALQLLADVQQVDVRPLFELLRDLGGADVATVLAQFPPNANALQYLRNKNTTRISPTVKTYALMALANLPDGEGVPNLAALAGDPGVPVTNKPSEPFQMLAQASVDFTDAGKALVDLARAKQIPDRAWTAVADALTGKHLQFPSQLTGGTLPGQTEADVSGVEAPFRRGFYDDKHNILYEERSVSGDWSAKQVQQQLALIDKLLKVTSNPTGLKALQQARVSLQGRQPLSTRQ